MSNKKEKLSLDSLKNDLSIIKEIDMNKIIGGKTSISIHNTGCKAIVPQ